MMNRTFYFGPRASEFFHCSGKRHHFAARNQFNKTRNWRVSMRVIRKPFVLAAFAALSIGHYDLCLNQNQIT